tara:strand:- start:735 stop:2606 length:1872 start_codon:yes stop_codon:yes gene_type:complete
MKTDIETLKDSFQMGYEAYWASRVEADEVWNLYHNRQWTYEQQMILENRGQPKETFNVIKLFARMLVGYYSTVVNTVRAAPVQLDDSTIASLMTSSINSVFTKNRLATEGDEAKLCGMISGLMAMELEPVFTGSRDVFGRPIYTIRMSQVYDYELVLDPMSKDRNYDDARFLHRFKWVPSETIVKNWGKAKLDELEAYYNHLDVDEAEFEYTHGDQFQGRYRVFDNYLIVRTVIEDDAGKRWDIWWSNDTILEKNEITYREVKWPYRVVRLHSSSKTEYYGIFREVVESQKAINQALVKLQLMVNTQKVFAEKTALDGSLADFTDAVNRVTGVIQVKSLKGIRVEDLSREALEQYAVIDRALDRIQRILSVNDSFLGMAYASDSGRKVKLQQNATVMALRYLTVRIEAFYELVGKDVTNLIKQYYTATQVLQVSDTIVGSRYIELNKPMQMWSGEMNANGEPIMTYVFEPALNPDTQEQEVDDNGNLVFAPVPEEGTELPFTEYDISIESVAYNDEDERTQLMLEQVMSGNIGQMMMQVNPVGFFQIASLMLRRFKTKYSPEVAEILNQTAQMLGGSVELEAMARQIAAGAPNGPGINGTQGDHRGSNSQQLKLPTNTNEEAL